MSKISLKHSGGNVVSLNSPTNAPSAADVAFKLPNADGSDGQAIVTDGSGNLSFANAGGGRAHNLILNGAMTIAQRGVSSTSNGYQTVDRWKLDSSNITHNSTKSQQSLSSSDTPYTLGFRKFARIALSQAGVVATNSYVEFQQKIEAQNISNSGWNYTSSSSFITVQFWFRCSTNQTFYAWVTSTDGTNKRFTFSFTASGNNAWTKITKTIPGASGIQIDDNNEEGFNFVIAPFYGTDYTGSVSLDTWVTKNDATHSPDYASTWLTAGASTFDLTGVQLEVGSTASDFSYESYPETLTKCQRYYQKVYYYTYTGSTSRNILFYEQCQFHPYMRADPSLVAGYDTTNANDFETRDGTTWRAGLPTLVTSTIYGASVRPNNSADINFIKGILDFSAEL